MKTHLVAIAMSAMLTTINASADFVSGDMTLRDAIYLYEQDVDARGSKVLGANNCDVFQLVLDVTSGYTDLIMFNGENENGQNVSAFEYPDRIYDSAAMFAYALYTYKPWKAFKFYDKDNPLSSAQIGKGTIFGYCFSTRPDARIYFREDDECTFTYSDGSTQPIPYCVPS